MADPLPSRLGADLALTRYTGTAGGPALVEADSWGSLDLRVVPGGSGVAPVGSVEFAEIAGDDGLQVSI
ncbi:MAG TPA: hypothetical protein PK413_05795, partial [Thermoanaerobaculia bacterium]|nr:hypothetical protein [Thermoanaerobaculia bacterium]